MPKRLGSLEVIRVLQPTALFLYLKRAVIANTVTPAAIWPSSRILKRMLPIGTTRAIIRQSGLAPADFGF